VFYACVLRLCSTLVFYVEVLILICSGSGQTSLSIALSSLTSTTHPESDVWYWCHLWYS